MSRAKRSGAGAAADGATGSKGGRPPLFTDPRDFERKANSYFANCARHQRRPTSSGLALALGFASRQSLTDYAHKREFAYVAKRALLRLEVFYEERLWEPQAGGAIFWLKNRGWTDRRELTGPGGGPLALLTFVNELPEDTVRRLMALPEQQRKEELAKMIQTATAVRGLLGPGEDPESGPDD